MSQEHQAYDSDNDFEKPKDDFMFYYHAFKIEEKKMCAHQKFEDITTKYWQLIKYSLETNYAKTTVTKTQYVQLMKAIYKALLPLYREQEMSNEIDEEWLLDSRGQEELSFQLLTKVLFRVAHQWCTHIDIDEYIEMLEKIFNRITYMEVNSVPSYSQNCNSDDSYGYYRVTFPLLEKKAQEGAALSAKMAQEGGGKSDDWLECRSDESNRSEYDYKYEEDPEQMVVKKYKKQKAADSGLNGPGALSMIIKDPIVYDEEILYDNYQLEKTDYQIQKLRPLDQILPFGLPTQFFLQKVKQEVQQELDAYKEQAQANLRKEQANDGGIALTSQALAANFGFQDPGMKDESNSIPENNDFYLIDKYAYACMLNPAYNMLRKTLKDGAIMSLRLHNTHPKGNARSRSRATLSSNDTLTEINKFGYNPALERRVHFKYVQDLTQIFSVSLKWHNIYYLSDLPENVDQYRADINRIETKEKLCLKENDEIRKEEDFNHVETTYKKLRQIMLYKKYEAIYSDRSHADSKEHKRLKKLIDKEEKRKQNALKGGNIAQKGLSETYEEKSFIKMMKGPFYQLDSLDGLRNDDFVNCAEQDLIEAARTHAMRILVIGKPRAGKSTLSANLAKKLDLVHINIENWIKALIAKIAAIDPEPPQLEEGEEPPKYLTDFEEEIYQALKQGGGPTEDHQIEILKILIRSPAAVLKGYILDLSYYNKESSWASIIRQRYLLSEPDELGQTFDFTHIVELWCEDEDVRTRAHGMRVNPDDGVVYSKWERDERNKPKPVSEEEDPVDEENEVKPLQENALVQRSEDSEDKIKDELNYYNTVERPAMEELLINFFDSQYIRLDVGGLIPDEIVDCVSCRIKPDEDLPLRALAIQIEGGSDYKSLLTEGVNLEEGELPRKWSLWRQTDPVALFQGKVVQGQPENAAHYHGNVFVFSTEENMKAFIAEPKKYLFSRPEMPQNYRVLMMGPKGVGRHTQAQVLSDLYGWTVVDYKELVKAKLEELLKFEIQIPNNPQQGGRIGMSEQELADIAEGKSTPAWKFIPWIFDYLNYPLMKKKPPPPEEKQEEEQQEEEAPPLSEAEMKKKLIEEKRKREEEERKRKEEEELQKFKEDRRRRRQEAIEAGQDPISMGIEDSEEEPIIIEDLSIDQLVLKEDEETGKIPFVGGFILVGFPESEEHLNRLKAHGIEFDSIIYLNDGNDENEPGNEVRKRMKDVELYDFDAEFEQSQKIWNIAKEQYPDGQCKEIFAKGNLDDVLIRIRVEIDPFFVKVDDPENCRTSADLSGDDNEKKLPKSDFGDYCPVTYVKDNWIVRGNPENEVTVFGKTHWLAGASELEEFKFNPKMFLVTQFQGTSLPLQPPPPRIMILGHRGAGTTSQIRMLCEKYKLEEFDLKKEYIAKLKEEKEKRKRRRLLDRGFRPPQPAEEEGGEAPPDPEIEDDPEDFEKEVHERQVMKMIYNNTKGYFIDGNWRDIPEGTINQTFTDLLFESRRVPEVVIILKCKEKATFDRCIDRQTIRNQFDKLMEARDTERARVRREEREAYYAEITQVQGEDEERKSEEEIADLMTQWEEARDSKEKDDDENDPEMPNYDAMENVEREKLQEQRTADDTMFEELANILREKQVVVIDDIKGDLSQDFIHIKLIDRLKDNFTHRKDIIERQLAQPLKAKEVKNFEKSYIYKHSKFGPHSPISLANPAKSKNNAVLYRERLYFLSDATQQQKFLKEPSKYVFNGEETVPLDIHYKPKVFIVGPPYSGKTTLSEQLKTKLNLVHLRIQDIIDQFISRDSHPYITLSRQMKMEGRHIDDDALVNLILKRIQFKDCQTQGWVIDDFPKTRNQCLFLAKKGIVPTNLIVMRIDTKTTYDRSQDKSEQLFGSFRTIHAQRLKHFYTTTPQVISFYQKLYNNVVEINATRSKWFIEDKAIGEIQRSLHSRQQFAKEYHLREKENRACKMRDMHVDRSLMKQSLSEFKYYCPVTWKNEKLLQKCSANKEDCVLIKNSFFYFKSTKERDLFIANPQRFTQNVQLPKDKEMPLRVQHHKASEILLSEKHLNAHCSVTLVDEERVRKGDPLLLILFREAKFVFENEFKLQRFLANPFKYAKASLPVKMPPPEDKISLFNLQKMDDSIAFMEQSLGQVVTRGLREVSENRLKHPRMSVKETMLKLFALFLKTENPANTPYMKKKYQQKMRTFIQRCELPEELYDLGIEKQNAKAKGQWPEYKEKYYNTKGDEYDSNMSNIDIEKADNFLNYMR